MHIHILGICGTFMGSLAILARELGHDVSGCDQNVYPPMSTQLEAQGIELMQGYLPEHLTDAAAHGLGEPDLVIIGNAMSRGNPCVEAVLDRGMAYTSGPQWLSEHVLKDKWVLAVAGTHGKTTTSSMLAAILEFADMAPGYLIGGVPKNFAVSARLGDTPFFVIEADEYDSAFFDKRSKFVHYRPRTCVINNIEFDHADIFDDLAAIRKQFHHLVRTVPSNGLIIAPRADTQIQQTLALGCWSPVQDLELAYDEANPAEWAIRLLKQDGSHFEVLHTAKGQTVSAGELCWDLTGMHNVSNALAAIAASHHVGVRAEMAVAALNQFAGVKRRMELLGEPRGIRVYDDFAHHPTAIASTIEGAKAASSEGRVFAVIEPRSNTMRLGQHQSQLRDCVASADACFWFEPAGMDWNLAGALGDDAQIFDSIETLMAAIVDQALPGDRIIIMSNGGFQGIHGQLLNLLAI